jgi:hypothetical protein
MEIWLLVDQLVWKFILQLRDIFIAIAVFMWYLVLLKEGGNMPKRLEHLYNSFFKQQDFNELNLSVEENHKILIDRLSKEDRKTGLRIIDALGMICNYQSKARFIQGFALGMELATELNNYDHSLEAVLNDCGQFFMPKGGSDDES